MLDKNKEIDFNTILEENDFTESDNNIKEEIKEVDELFTLIKSILLKEVNGSTDPDKPLRLGTIQTANRKNTRFISDLVTNLTSIKTLKLNLEKQRTDNKKDYLNRILKVLTESGKIEETKKGGENYSELLNFVMSNTNLEISSNMINLNESLSDDETLDSVLLESKNQIALETKTPKKPKKRLKSYDMEGNFLFYSVINDKLFLVNTDYEIIREVKEEEVEIEEDGEVYYDAKTNCIIELSE